MWKTKRSNSTPGLGRSPGGGNGSPLQYCCLGNPTDRGAWRAAVHGAQRLRHDLVTQPHLCYRTHEDNHICLCVCASVSMCVCVCVLSPIWLFVTPWTAALQAPLSMGLPRQQYWSGLPCPPPGDLPEPEIKPMSPALADRFFPAEPLGKPITGLDRSLQMVTAAMKLKDA